MVSGTVLKIVHMSYVRNYILDLHLFANLFFDGEQQEDGRRQESEFV